MMPRYFFHLRVGATCVTDDHGEEFAGPAEAEAHGRCVCNELARNTARHRNIRRSLLMVDSEGNELREIPLDAVEDAPSLWPQLHFGVERKG